MVLHACMAIQIRKHVIKQYMAVKKKEATFKNYTHEISTFFAPRNENLTRGMAKQQSKDLNHGTWIVMLHQSYSKKSICTNKKTIY